MTNKVYSVTVDFTGLMWHEAAAKNAQLDAEIQKLAKKSGADVHMHQYKEPLMTQPEVLVEAPASFIEEVKKLPLFNSVRPVDQSVVQTIRRTNAPQIEPPEAQAPKGPRR